MARPKNHRDQSRPARIVRVRSRPLAEIDEAKLATALAIMARRLLEQRAAETADIDRQHGSTSGEEAA